MSRVNDVVATEAKNIQKSSAIIASETGKIQKATKTIQTEIDKFKAKLSGNWSGTR